MFRRISVLVPTRGRVPQLRAMLESFESTARGRGADLVFRIDRDDEDTRRVLDQAYPCTTLVGDRYDGYLSLIRFFDECRTVATGDLLMCGNDDMVFQSPNWPQMVLEEANHYPDGIFNIGVETLNAHVFPFSIVSMQAVRILGHLHDPRLRWCGDLYLRDVMGEFFRAIRLPSVKVDHRWTAENWTAAVDPDFPMLYRQCVREAVGKLHAASVFQDIIA